MTSTFSLLIRRQIYVNRPCGVPVVLLLIFLHCCWKRSFQRTRKAMTPIPLQSCHWNKQSFVEYKPSRVVCANIRYESKTCLGLASKYARMQSEMSFLRSHKMTGIGLLFLVVFLHVSSRRSAFCLHHQRTQFAYSRLSNNLPQSVTELY